MSAARERRLGAFRLEDGEGQSGSQGAVYRAVCDGPFPGVAVGETVALKTMPCEEEPERQERFERRVAELVALDDAHVARYRGCFRAEGKFDSRNVIVMDWLDGETLRDRLAREPGGLDADVALRIADGLLAGLAAAQSAGLVHRDVKPGNVFLCRDGSVKLIDFEVARRVAVSSLDHSTTGGFAGTFDYMAPEFADTDFRGTTASDVFSAGVVLHEMLTGQMPYARAAENGEQADFAFLSRWSQRKEGLCAIRILPSVRRVLAKAHEVLFKALAEDPAERYADAAAFRAALRQIRYREVRSVTDDYRLLRVVGEGGFGCVYKALMRGTGKYVAVKQLKRPEYGDRFRREAHVMRRLDDPAFVRLVDYFETKDVSSPGAFLVMDFLPGMPGSSLRDAIRRTQGAGLPFADVLTAFARYAGALSLMHRQRIYHRDIKPSNLYYPGDDPARAAIMDLGIARDMSGTATVGQVPGTLDYMPPEVVLGGSRGDAGMDIYALGLCLYEALSGRSGYPRLPSGSRAFPAFYERARSRTAPVFDASVVRDRPALQALLRDMTALDPGERLQDAEVLKRRLAAIAVESSSVRTVALVSQAEIPTARGDLAEADTGATAGGEAGLSPFDLISSFPDGRARKALAGVAAVVAVLLALVLSWKPLVRGFVSVRGWFGDRGRRVITEVDRAETDRLRQKAAEEAASVLAAFEGTNVTAVAADSRASQWKLKWRGEPHLAEFVKSRADAFAAAYANRLDRDAAAAATKRRGDACREGAVLILDIRGTNAVTSACEDRYASWKTNWLGAIESAVYSKWSDKIARELCQRRNRDAEDARRHRERERERVRLQTAGEKAVAASVPVVAAYGDESRSLAAADAAYAAWRTAWRDMLGCAPVSNAAERIAAARKVRAGTESGNRVVTECNRYLDSIPLVGPETVKNWRDLVRQAEIALEKAEAVGGVAPRQAEAVRARISGCRKWVVGVIDNKSDRPVDFGGRRVGPVSAVTVVFTNGYPVGASVKCEGCEPIHVREERFSACVYVVMPRELDERACETKAILPACPKNVRCFVDGTERRSGEIQLRRGRHEVKYCRREETYPGVYDYEPKTFSFETCLGKTVEAPVPTGAWVVSSDFRRAREQQGLVKRGREIETACRRFLQPLPLETRRTRLEKAHALLKDWQTPSALSVLGVGAEKALWAEYSAERARTRGFVRNATKAEVSVTTDRKPVAVHPGERVLVTFEKEWPSDARVVVPGYEFVMLPREASAFDGTTFEVRAERLVPLPVRVEVPSAGEGVSCRVDRTAASGVVWLRPGEHEAVWTKADHEDQKIPFAVSFGTPRSVPAPGKWEPNGALSGLKAAFKAFNSGAVEAAKDLTDGIGDIEDPARRRELEDLKRAIELRKRLEGN